MRPYRGYVSQFFRSSFISAKALSVDSLKYSRLFFATVAEWEKSQWFSKEQFAELQQRKLEALIRHAYDNVPFYRRAFDERGLKPADVRCPADLKKLPVVDKATLRKNPADFVARNFSHLNRISGWTTGTTGTPLNALRSRESIAIENAMIWRQRRLAGLRYRCRKVAVWGTIWENIIVPAHQRVPPYWQYNLTDNQLLFSYYHMSDATLEVYIQRLEAFQPELIEGFPSTLLVLARYLKKKGKVIPVKGIFTSSETLYDVHRRELEESFGTRVFDLYGQAERVVAATECEHHAGLHINPEYGIFEILKDDQDASPGEPGDVVGTGLNNFVMPLLRYRTGDMATLSKDQCVCGRQMPLLARIEGRKSDIIRTPDGRMVPGNGLMGAFHGIANIKRSQVIQEALDHVVVNIQREDLTKPIDAAKLGSNLAQCLGEHVKIEVRLPDQIETGGRNKFRWMISRISTDDAHKPEAARPDGPTGPAATHSGGN
jgi:phenylacetate-CoA ligase